MPPKFTISLILLLITLVTYIYSCEEDQMHYGCRISDRQCNCGYGCKSEFRYSTKEDCKKALNGKEDICALTKPCSNFGVCSQISRVPKYKCSCQGTRFYGPRCEKPCPGPNSLHVPLECIVI